MKTEENIIFGRISDKSPFTFASLLFDKLAPRTLQHMPFLAWLTISRLNIDPSIL